MPISSASLPLPLLLQGPADVDGRDGGGEEQADENEDEDRVGEVSDASVEDDSERKNMLCILTVRRSDGILGIRDLIDAGSAAIRSDGISSDGLGESGAAVDDGTII